MHSEVKERNKINIRFIVPPILFFKDSENIFQSLSLNPLLNLDMITLGKPLRILYCKINPVDITTTINKLLASRLWKFYFC